ncbi:MULTISPECIES: hypothetical protein [Trichocoleus]|uniref:Uncharacterized protein n=1 Tax=Trichocoleus desertorum GB2-A4 TaxID=2933944 RepID=A0ABV0JCL8_9CYAN|nr:hypothetical protein [Trichocoleus sp. FACHB-46]MBD1864173.1 hypothetical protein [Trichocoleus sp. FACHB-46]
MTLVFNQTKLGLLNRSLDLTSGTFYLQLVTVVPTDPAITSVAQLFTATGGNYAPFIFNNLPVLSTSGDAAIASFDTVPYWPQLATNGAASIKGSVLCKQVGGGPSPSDPILCYNDLAIPFSPNGTANFRAILANTGVLRLLFSEGLVFTQTLLGLLNRALNLTSGTFYAHLVTTAPTAPAFTAVSQLTLATGGNYAPVLLSGLGFGTNGNAALWQATNPTWSNLTTDNAATIKGAAICRQLGATPAPTDALICYKPLNSTQFPTGYVTNGSNFTAEIGATNGLLRMP